MKNILVPTDFSHNSWNAIAYALMLFKDIPCNFYILNVAQLNQSGVNNNSFVPSASSQKESTTENFADTLEKIWQLNPNKEHQFIVLQEYGNLIDIIRRTVIEKKIKLIVMGTKGASGLKESIIGSNTGNVMTKVHCNLLIIPEKAVLHIPKEIAFPTDYTIFYSYSILEAIAQMLRICKANLRVVRVSKPNIQPNRTQKLNMIYLKDYLGELFEKSHSVHHLKHEKIKNAIEDFVSKRKIDLIIMVAKNLNFLQQLLFDTSIKRIGFQTSVPLLVLHE